MFDYILNILQDLGGSVVKGADWIWKYMVPDAVKSKVKSQMPASFGSMVLYVFNIFQYWYFYMAIAGIIVVYKLFKALKDTGIYEAFEKIVWKTMNSVFYIADMCFPLINNFESLTKCIQDAPNIV